MAYKIWVTTVNNDKEIALFISNLTKIQFGVEGLSSDHEPIFKSNNTAIIQLKVNTLKHPKSDDAVWVRDRILEVLSTSKLNHFSLIVCSDTGKTAWSVNDPGVKIESKNITVKRSVLEDNLIRAGIKPKEKEPEKIKLIEKPVEETKPVEEIKQTPVTDIIEKNNTSKINIDENIFNTIIKILDKSTQISDVFFENNKIERKEALNYILNLKKNISEQ